MESALLERLFLHASTHLPRPSIPAFLYGCAWKKDKTSRLVCEALSAGFTGIDVAAQPKHYDEPGAGDGIRRAITQGKIARKDLFIQTKYTPISGQDLSNVPYDSAASISSQVHASIASSLYNLRVDDDPQSDCNYLDSLILHSPLPTMAQTKEAWQACEEHVPHKVRNLGISNTTLTILEELYASARIKPSVVQNRFYRNTQYEVELRRFCRQKGIVFQSFWTLSANPHLLRIPPVVFLSKETNTEPAIALYCLVLGLKGTIILNGTQSHIQSDLESLDRVRNWAKENEYEWADTQKHFNDMIGESP